MNTNLPLMFPSHKDIEKSEPALVKETWLARIKSILIEWFAAHRAARQGIAFVPATQPSAKYIVFSANDPNVANPAYEFVFDSMELAIAAVKANGGILRRSMCRECNCYEVLVEGKCIKCVRHSLERGRHGES